MAETLSAATGGTWDETKGSDRETFGR